MKAKRYIPMIMIAFLIITSVHAQNDIREFCEAKLTKLNTLVGEPFSDYGLSLRDVTPVETKEPVVEAKGEDPNELFKAGIREKVGTEELLTVAGVQYRINPDQSLTKLDGGNAILTTKSIQNGYKVQDLKNNEVTFFSGTAKIDQSVQSGLDERLSIDAKRNFLLLNGKEVQILDNGATIKQKEGTDFVSKAGDNNFVIYEGGKLSIARDASNKNPVGISLSGLDDISKGQLETRTGIKIYTDAAKNTITIDWDKKSAVYESADHGIKRTYSGGEITEEEYVGGKLVYIRKTTYDKEGNPITTLERKGEFFFQAADFLTTLAKTRQEIAGIQYWLDKSGTNRFLFGDPGEWITGVKEPIKSAICERWTKNDNAPSSIGIGRGGFFGAHIDGERLEGPTDEKGQQFYIYRVTFSVIPPGILANPQKDKEQGKQVVFRVYLDNDPLPLDKNNPATYEVRRSADSKEIRVDSSNTIVRELTALYDTVCLDFGPTSDRLDTKFRSFLTNDRLCNKLTNYMWQNVELPADASNDLFKTLTLRFSSGSGSSNNQNSQGTTPQESPGVVRN